MRRLGFYGWLACTVLPAIVGYWVRRVVEAIAPRTGRARAEASTRRRHQLDSSVAALVEITCLCNAAFVIIVFLILLVLVRWSLR
jgi:hypothetical protein